MQKNGYTFAIVYSSKCVSVFCIRCYVSFLIIKMFPQISVTIIIVDSILWNSKTQKMTPFEVMTTFEGIVFLPTFLIKLFKNSAVIWKLRQKKSGVHVFIFIQSCTWQRNSLRILTGMIKVCIFRKILCYFTPSWGYLSCFMEFVFEFLFTKRRSQKM